MHLLIKRGNTISASLTFLLQVLQTFTTEKATYKYLSSSGSFFRFFFLQIKVFLFANNLWWHRKSHLNWSNFCMDQEWSFLKKKVWKRFQKDAFSESEANYFHSLSLVGIITVGHHSRCLTPHTAAVVLISWNWNINKISYCHIQVPITSVSFIYKYSSKLLSNKMVYLITCWHCIQCAFLLRRLLRQGS